MTDTPSPSDTADSETAPVHFPDITILGNTSDGNAPNTKNRPHSLMVHREAGMRAVLFIFSPDQELADHAARVPVILQIMQGRAEITIGNESFEAGPKSWTFIPSKVVHSVRAHEATHLLLTLLPGETKQ